MHFSAMILLTVCLIAIISCWQATASLADGRKYGLQHSAASHRLGESMVPLSVGVETYGGHVEYCLMRGSWLPTERSRILTTTQFEFLESSRVIAGERHTNAASNVVLGKWDVPSVRWGIDKKRPYASYIKPTSPHDDGNTAKLVVMSCDLDEEEVLTITMTPVNLTILGTSGTSLHIVPLLSKAVGNVIFKGPMDAKTLHDDAIAQHIEEADLFASVDAPRRHAATAKLSFEQLVMALWHALEQQHPATTTTTTPVGGAQVAAQAAAHHHHHHAAHHHHVHHDEDTAVLQRAVVDGVRILVENAGTHQNEQFWLHLETSLRHRIAFDDDEEGGDEPQHQQHTDSAVEGDL